MVLSFNCLLSLSNFFHSHFELSYFIRSFKPKMNLDLELKLIGLTVSLSSISFERYCVNFAKVEIT